MVGRLATGWSVPTPLAALVVLVWPLGVAAQATLTVRVTDPAGQPVRDAAVTARLAGQVREARTDSVGAVRLVLPSDGTATLTVRRLGFRVVTSPFAVALGDNSADVALDAAADDLDTVRVMADRAVPRRLAGFEQRLAAKQPTWAIGRDEIDRRNVPKVSALLRATPSIKVAIKLGQTVATSNRSGKPSLRAGGAGLVECPLRVLVDGILMPELYDLDDLGPNEIHGIEVYAGPARIPPEFPASRADSYCGLIAIWTRAGTP